MNRKSQLATDYLLQPQRADHINAQPPHCTVTAVEERITAAAAVERQERPRFRWPALLLVAFYGLAKTSQGRWYQITGLHPGKILKYLEGHSSNPADVLLLLEGKAESTRWTIGSGRLSSWLQSSIRMTLWSDTTGHHSSWQSRFVLGQQSTDILLC